MGIAESLTAKICCHLFHFFIHSTCQHTQRSWSVIETIGTELGYQLMDTHFSNLRTIAFEGPSNLSDSDLELMVNMEYN